MAMEQSRHDDRCRITVRGRHGAEQVFDIRRNELLLKAALEQGIEYPHNCRVGVCGTCKTRLLQGRISPMVDLALSPLSNDQLRQGYVLACQARVRGDLVVEATLGRHAVLPVKSVPGRVVRWRRLAGGVIDLRVKLDAPIRFHAGQYAVLAESGSFTRRSYSFYDAPPPGDAETWEVGFLVKHLPGGAFSEWLFEADRSGAKLWLEGPYGVMGVDEPDRDGICVASGTGLAPILSIVADRLRRSTQAHFTVVVGLRSARDDFAGDYLRQLAEAGAGRVRVITVLSREPADSAWSGARGRVTQILTAALGVDFKQAAAFICGNPAMVAASEQRLLDLGVLPERLHADKFAPSGTP